MSFHGVPAKILAAILWVTTAILGLVEIFIVREMVLRLYARFGSRYWPGVSLGNWAVLVMSLVWLALTVGGGEYHRQRVGRPGSWRLFGATLAIEIAILLLALVV